MNRRNFLKTAAAGAAALRQGNWMRATEAITLPPHAERVPLTPLNAPAGTWTLAVLPDTQNYSSRFPEVFDRQCDWIVAHRHAHNIRFVAHEGDIVNEQKPVKTYSPWYDRWLATSDQQFVISLT